MAGSLGSGQVEYHADRPVIHFAITAEQLEEIERAARLRAARLQTTERMPS